MSNDKPQQKPKESVRVRTEVIKEGVEPPSAPVKPPQPPKKPSK